MGSSTRCKATDDHGHRCKRKWHDETVDARHTFKGKGHA